jgi:predicted DNA-binding helix-hairpin-helix protein
METIEKLAISAQAMEFESDGESCPVSQGMGFGAATGGCLSSGRSQGMGHAAKERSVTAMGHTIPVHMAAGPQGRRIPLLKAMITTACEMDCHYCSFRAGRDFRRVTFKPEELAQIFLAVYQKGEVEGLFLSTGILRGGANTQNKLLDAAEILRKRLGYRGYLHLKIMPGSEKGQLLKAMHLADRVSINLEAPNANRLAPLAPRKQFDEQLIRPFHWMEEIRMDLPPYQTWNGRWPSSTTQFVVGPAGESDLELMSTVAALHRTPGFTRAYFEAFRPVPGTPLEAHTPEEPLRQHRLYQASFLLRDYGFDLEDLPFTSQGNLPLEQDPKMAYAMMYLIHAPVELNRASREQLVRVPGIGPKGASAILKARKEHSLHDLVQLRKLGILHERAAPYITLNGKQPKHQMKLF